MMALGKSIARVQMQPLPLIGKKLRAQTLPTTPRSTIKPGKLTRPTNARMNQILVYALQGRTKKNK